MAFLTKMFGGSVLKERRDMFVSPEGPVRRTPDREGGADSARIPLTVVSHFTLNQHCGLCI